MPRPSRTTALTLAGLLLVLLGGGFAEAGGTGTKVKPKAKAPREVFLKLSGVT